MGAQCEKTWVRLFIQVFSVSASEPVVAVRPLSRRHTTHDPNYRIFPPSITWWTDWAHGLSHHRVLQFGLIQLWNVFDLIGQVLVVLDSAIVLSTLSVCAVSVGGALQVYTAGFCHSSSDFCHHVPSRHRSPYLGTDKIQKKQGKYRGKMSYRYESRLNEAPRC